MSGSHFFWMGRFDGGGTRQGFFGGLAPHDEVCDTVCLRTEIERTGIVDWPSAGIFTYIQLYHRDVRRIIDIHIHSIASSLR